MGGADYMSSNSDGLASRMKLRLRESENGRAKEELLFVTAWLGAQGSLGHRQWVGSRSVQGWQKGMFESASQHVFYYVFLFMNILCIISSNSIV
jgi:hypothetical protein